MENMDTILLLQECESGAKMGADSIGEVIEKVHDSDMRALLMESIDQHRKAKEEIKTLLKEYKAEEKEPDLMAKGMSWIKTNVKLGLDNSDATIAELITDGANMGIKSLNQYLNEYKTADHSAKKICKKLIESEEKLCKDLQKYL